MAGIARDGKRLVQAELLAWMILEPLDVQSAKWLGMPDRIASSCRTVVLALAMPAMTEPGR